MTAATTPTANPDATAIIDVAMCYQAGAAAGSLARLARGGSYIDLLGHTLAALVTLVGKNIHRQAKPVIPNLKTVVVKDLLSPVNIAPHALSAQTKYAAAGTGFIASSLGITGPGASVSFAMLSHALNYPLFAVTRATEAATPAKEE